MKFAVQFYHMKKTFIFLSCFFASLNFLLAQQNQNVQLENSLDSLIAPQFKQNEPGVSILIAKQGQIIYEKAFGSANLELNVAMKPDMVFRIGSITKQFTAIGILQLVEQGKISLQDSVQKYIPDFPSKGRTITIENLLTHTSGIIDYSSMNDPDPYIERRDFTPQFLINYFKNEPLQFQPGTKYGYSNSNYVLLAYIIEKVSGKPYHDYMKENVLGRAGLTHTYWADENTIVPDRVQGYTRYKGFYENCDYQTISLGYGCADLLSTVEDLYKWNNALLAYKLVKKETLEKAFTPFTLNNDTRTTYGYGWFIDSLAGVRRIRHEGQVSGFIAQEEYFPDMQTYVALMTNVKTGDDTTGFSDGRFRLFNNIFLLALGKEPEKEVAVSDSILNKYMGTYSATFKKNSTLTIYKKDGQLYLDLSNGTGKNMIMLPQSETEFILPDIKSVKTSCKFINENGKPLTLIFTQDKNYVWKKINE
jgi:CubicO group peptidase (beta-lactamase class C family)